MGRHGFFWLVVITLGVFISLAVKFILKFTVLNFGFENSELSKIVLSSPFVAVAGTIVTFVVLFLILFFDGVLRHRREIGAKENNNIKE